MRLLKGYCLVELVLVLIWSNVCLGQGKSELAARLARVATAAKNVQLGLSVIDLRDSQEIYAFNAKSALRPASVLKILVSNVALSELGPDYTFETKAYYDSSAAGSVKTLFVKGLGDPTLSTDSAIMLARDLRQRGVRSISKLVLDNSAFVEDQPASGQRAYQTGTAALAFNYNSLAFEICPRELGQEALVAYDPSEYQIKLLKQARTVSGSGFSIGIDKVSASSFKVYGKIGANAHCVTLYRSIDNSDRVLAAVFKKAIQDVGISGALAVDYGAVADRAELLLDHRSPALSRIISDLNHFSTNFIAEQVLFQLGQQPDGRFSREAGLKRLAGFLTALGYANSEFSLVDASGLSHENRISARILTELLKIGFNSPTYGPEFVASLSVGERSGTLKKRRLSLNGGTLRAKTGTIDGVSSLAGYFFSAKGEKYAFTIIQNGVTSKEAAVKLEDSIISTLSE